jgi:hypothetical protein
MDLLSSYLRLTPNAFTAILVVIDRLSNIPTTDTVISPDVADAFVSNVF